MQCVLHLDAGDVRRRNSRHAIGSSLLCTVCKPGSTSLDRGDRFLGNCVDTRHSFNLGSPVALNACRGVTARLGPRPPSVVGVVRVQFWIYRKGIGLVANRRIDDLEHEDAVPRVGGHSHPPTHPSPMPSLAVAIAMSEPPPGSPSRTTASAPRHTISSSAVPTSVMQASWRQSMSLFI